MHNTTTCKGKRVNGRTRASPSTAAANPIRTGIARTSNRAGSFMVSTISTLEAHEVIRLSPNFHTVFALVDVPCSML